MTALPGRYLARHVCRRKKPVEVAVEVFDHKGARRLRTIAASPKAPGTDRENLGILLESMGDGWELVPMEAAG